ncbi:MAG: radical SAM protein [Candidatus Omnitrophica bacterium]|nr:radical SAM protein [Candidatus Omnitrophota bacterium]
MRILKKIIAKLNKYEFVNANTKLIVGNKQVQVYYKKTKISNDLGLHTAFLINGSWHDTSSGIWQIENKQDVLHITVDWENLPIRVLWQISKEKNGFSWIVYLDIKDSMKITKSYSGITLQHGYEQWFSEAEQGIFPEIKDTWESVFLADPKSKVFGLEKTAAFPGIIFKNLFHGQLLIQNSPKSNSSRALRIERDYYDQPMVQSRQKLLKAEILFADEQILFAKIKQQSIVQSLQNRQLIEANLKLELKDQTIQLFWGDQQLTKGAGLHSALCVAGQWFDSSKCIWQIERINAQSIYIDIDWRPLAIRQSWQIMINNEHCIEWKVSTDIIDANAVIEKQVAGLVLKPEYKQWFGGYESGNFSSEFADWQQIIKDKADGVIGLKSQDKNPGIMFKTKKPSCDYLLVQNSDQLNQARYLQAFRESDLPGESEFVLEISIIPENDLIEQHLIKKMHDLIMHKGIENNKIKLLADKGRLRIFWKNKEITTDIGLHTALYSGNHWYDSGKINWDVNKISNSQMEVIIDFKPFPAIQKWNICLKDDQAIDWNVITELKKAVEIKQRKSGIILNSGYKRWFNSFEQGLFPEQFGFWHDIIRNRDGETFGTYADNGLPAVMFSIDPDHMSLIQNADQIVQGRALQAQVIETEQTSKYPQGKSLEFNGRIYLSDDNKCIDDYKYQSQPLRLEPESSYIYADNSALHDRIAKVEEFENKISNLRKLKNQGKIPEITIGVSRYNFFKLNEILQFVAQEIGKPIDLRSLTLNIFPLKRLRRNFIEYLDELKKIAKRIGGIEFVLADDKLFELLTEIYTQAEIDNERQLLRLLGVICEHAFIGPQIVVIDPYHRCNANCVHCWVHTPSINHPQEFLDRKLSFDAFKNIADDLSDLYTDLMIFQGDGEPLLHERFFDMVKYGRAKGIEVSFFTNGLLLNKEVAKKAVDYGVSEIFCSLPAGKAETFAKINTKQDEKAFSTILENLRYLSDYKKQTKAKTPRLIVTHVIHTMNAHELVQMAENDIAIGADIMRFYLVRLDKNIEFLKLKPEDIQAIKQALPKIKQMVNGKSIQLLDTTEFQLNNFEPQTGSWSKDVFLQKGCALGWNFSLIPAAGDVSFCCHLRTVGYLKDKSFKEIWNSPEYERFRYQAKYLNEHKQEKFLNGTPMFDDYCQHCDTHQVIRDVWDKFALYNLEEFLT